MRALLGTILDIQSTDSPHGARPNMHTLRIEWKPRCVLPGYKSVPEWLKDKTLHTTRTVCDPRELGERGDALVLSVEESRDLLYPLSIEPEIARGELPKELLLRLHWWKDESPPNWNLRVYGRTHKGAWETEGALNDAPQWFARIATEVLASPPQSTLVTNFSALHIEASCESFRTECVVLPAQANVASKIIGREREVVRLENACLSLDISARHGGAIFCWRERGRGVDFFKAPAHLVQTPLDWGGHADRYKTGAWGDWSDKMHEAHLDTLEVRRGDAASRVNMAGIVDEGEHLRTSVSYSLLDDWPLLLLDRAWMLEPAKDKDAKPDEIKTPIDEARTLKVGFRCATAPDASTLDATNGSRVLCADGKRLSITRNAEKNELTQHENWTMRDGWAILEHPHRHENLLYLFDTHAPPYLATWHGPHAVTLEPRWPALTVRPGAGLGFQLAIAGGELCGASAAGGWVACRVRMGDKVLCAAIGRFRETQNAVAEFQLGNQTQSVPVQSTFLPGIGTIAMARAEFAAEGDGIFNAIMAGIPDRHESRRRET